MRDRSLFLYQAGSGKAPAEWFLKQTVHIQRLYYIKGGEGYAVGENGEKTRFEKGKLYLFPYNLSQRFVTTREDPVDHLYFDFLSSPPLIGTHPIVFDSARDLSLFHTLLAADEYIKAFSEEEKPRNFGRTSDAENASDAEYCRIVYSLFHSILLLLSRNMPLPFVHDEVILRTVDYMEENLFSPEPLRVKELAKRAGFEENYFIRRFKNALGMTPYAFLRSRRLYKARELIADGMSVTGAAEAVGYENASSLSRALGKKGAR